MRARAALHSAPGERVDDATANIRSAADGSFEAILRVPEGNAITSLRFDTDPAYEGPALSAQVERDSFPAGALELGEVTLTPPPIALSGRVVDAAGEPIYWAGIWVKRMTRGSPKVPPYHWVHEWQTQTQEDGSFLLVGNQGPGEYRLEADKDGYQRVVDVSFTPGTNGLEVVLLRTGELEGRVLLPDDVPATWLRVVAGPWKEHAPVHQTPRPHESGAFFLRQLPPGDASVTVYVPYWPEPLATVTGVSASDGGSAVVPPAPDRPSRRAASSSTSRLSVRTVSSCRRGASPSSTRAGSTAPSHSWTARPSLLTAHGHGRRSGRGARLQASQGRRRAPRDADPPRAGVARDGGTPGRPSTPRRGRSR